MRLITQPGGSAALLLEESVRMELANDIALSASWLDDHKHHFNNLHLFQTAAALCEKLHDIAHALAADRAGEIYDEEETSTGEDELERLRRLAGTACCGDEDRLPVESPVVAA